MKHASDVAVNYLDRRTFDEREDDGRSIVADAGRDVDDTSDSVAKSHVSFFSSVLQHLTLLLDSFEALLDIGDDDVECELSASLFTGVSVFRYFSVVLSTVNHVYFASMKFSRFSQIEKNREIKYTRIFRNGPSP